MWERLKVISFQSIILQFLGYSLQIPLHWTRYHQGWYHTVCHYIGLAACIAHFGSSAKACSRNFQQNCRHHNSTVAKATRRKACLRLRNDEARVCWTLSHSELMLSSREFFFLGHVVIYIYVIFIHIHIISCFLWFMGCGWVGWTAWESVVVFFPTPHPPFDIFSGVLYVDIKFQWNFGDARWANFITTSQFPPENGAKKGPFFDPFFAVNKTPVISGKTTVFPPVFTVKTPSWARNSMPSWNAPGSRWGCLSSGVDFQALGCSFQELIWAMKKTPGCLGYIGDYATSIMESQSFFLKWLIWIDAFFPPDSFSYRGFYFQ